SHLVFDAIYHVYLYPISGFPGSSLAALTFWYEFNDDVFRKGGISGRLKNAHKIWLRLTGPIIRTNPFEVYVNNLTFYGEV
ncbi:hypothetical protein K432DRAFT_264543, partial [Lepidopterella palustris CBS 459.81]